MKLSWNLGLSNSTFMKGKTMDISFLHVMVSSTSWEQTKVKYRRHRLVEYLQHQNDTADILWIYPLSATPRKPGSYVESNKVLKNNPSVNSHGVKEWAFPDYLPGRIMQFKSSYKHPQYGKLKKYIRGFKAKKILWYAYPAFPYLSNLIEWDRVVYDCSDLWTEPSGGKKSNTFSAKFSHNLIGSAEKEIIKSSTNIFASSQHLKERIENVNRQSAILVENGVDLSYLDQGQPDKVSCFDNIPQPRFGYVGALRSKIDFALLNELAMGNPNWSIVLIGPDCLNRKSEFQALMQNANVFWLGSVLYQDIPSYLSCLDVGLLPYREIEYNKAVFPIKFYEYLSQGLPVVGCGIPSTENYIDEGIYRHVKREQFINACGIALSWSNFSNKSWFDKRIKLAHSASWDSKFAKMLDMVRKE